MNGKIFSAFALMLLSSCSGFRPQPEHLLLTEQAPAPISLKKLEVRRDIDILVYALNEGYAGATHMPPGSFQALLDRLRTVRRQGALKRDAFCIEVDRALELAPDNHLRVTSDCAPPRSTDLRGSQVGKNFALGSKVPFLVRNERLGKWKIGLLGISSLPSSEDPVWAGFAAQARRVMKASNVLVIDVRGNSGGDDTTVINLASLLFGKGREAPLRTIVQRKSPESLTLQKNAFIARRRRFEREGKAVPESISENISSIEDELKRAASGEVSPEFTYAKPWGRWGEAVGFRGPIYILQNAGCASSCESFLEAMETHPHAITVGANSGGFIHFGEMAPLKLPNSQIRLQIATKFFRFADSRFVEKIGYAPEIKVPDQVDALAYVRQLLREAK